MRGERERRLGVTVSVVGLLLTPHLSPLTAQVIQDNSFLIEEGYNQERGVVQHVSTFERSSDGDWEFAFTQEWPLGGIRHQLSYTLPLQGGAGGTGLADVALNYRYQLVGDPGARTVVAPRVSILFPTGNERVGRGSGGLGFQANIPMTLVAGPRMVTHWNAGLTLTPSAQDPSGHWATATSINLGVSAVWLLRPSFNLLLEALWLDDRVVVGSGRTVPERAGYLSPGARMAFDAGEVEIVPGLAYTIGLGPDAAEDAVVLYLSFEHPFSHQ